MSVTRRVFLKRLGAVAGISATFSAMDAMGLFGRVASELPDLLPQFGKGTHVAVRPY